MHLLAGGPDVPNDVLAAHEEGTLALVCGAGISKLNGLPLFGELVHRVWESLGSACLPEVAEAVNRDEYDRAMGYLEARYTKRDVQRQVRIALRVPDTPDLATHKAILTLGKTRDRRLHIVTTNFDLLFEAAEPGVLSSAAPTLPVPKPEKWDSLVYLHGRFDDRDPDGRHLVMTSADFGTAYLTERWASRFVSELFAHFTVLFIGYSVNDPVMRYLVDAIAAERESGRDIKRAYAFVGANATADLSELRFEWSRKNVAPIPYTVTKAADGKPDHGLLHGTLRKWAELYEGGLESRKNVAYELGTKDPRGLSAEDKSRFLWAIENPDVMAHLAGMGTETSLGWIDLLNDHVEKCSTHEPPAVALVGWGGTSQAPAPLGRLPSELARWLSSYVTEPDLVRWVIRKGWRLHPDFAQRLRWRLDGARTSGTPSLSLAVEQAWQIMLGDDVEGYRADPESYHYDVVGALRNEPWGATLRRRTLNALSPWLRFGESYARLFPGGDEEQDGEASPRLGDLMRVEVELGAVNVTQSIVDALLARDDKNAVLADLSLDLTSLLRRALDAFAAASLAGSEWDPSLISQPSVAPHGQNNHIDNWTWLIDLNREAVDALIATDPTRAHRLADEWASIEYPTFRRLALYAAARLLSDDGA